MPRYFVPSWLTKEVTSTQKPRSHPAAPLSQAKEKECWGCSISGVIKGRERKERKPLVSFLNSHTHSSLQSSLNCIFCCVLNSITHEASRSKATFFSLEALATPLPGCSELTWYHPNRARRNQSSSGRIPPDFQSSCLVDSESSRRVIFKDAPQFTGRHLTPSNSHSLGRWNLIKNHEQN